MKRWGYEMIDHLLDVVLGKSKITKPIFVKEFSKENRELDHLLAIEDQVKDKKLQEQIRRDILFLKAGIQGESNVAFELSNSLLPMLCLHDIRLETEALSIQMDYIIITKKSILVFETKKLQGDIEITKDGDFIRVFKGKNGRIYKKEGIYSPVSQNQRQVRILEKILKDEKLIKRMPIKSYVILANPKTILHKKHAPKHIQENIYKYDQITQILKKELHVKTNMNVADKLMYKIADYLVENNKPITYDQSKYLDEVPVAATVVKEEVIEEPMDKEYIEKQLRKYRMKMAKQKELKPFMVFTNREMDALIEKNPETKKDLLQVRGFGKIKVEKYGDRLLEILGSNKVGK